MSSKVICCSICGSEGSTIYSKKFFCKSCDRITRQYISQYTISYYQTISLSIYGTERKWKTVFVDEELSKEPSFNIYKYHRALRLEEYEKQPFSPTKTIPVYYPEKHIPKCPTCQSTNLVKISNAKRITHGVTFGIFSKTAFSQYECKNCGYKW